MDHAAGAEAAMDSGAGKRARAGKRPVRPPSKHLRVFFDNANDRLYIDGKWWEERLPSLN